MRKIFVCGYFRCFGKKGENYRRELQARETCDLGALHLNARLDEELRASVTAHAALLTTPGVAAPRRERILGDAYARRRHRYTGSVDVFPFLLLVFFFSTLLALRACWCVLISLFLPANRK